MPPLLCSITLALALGGVTDLWSASSLQTEKADSPGWFSPNLLLVLNQDQLSGYLKQFKGDFQQKWGEFIDDDLLYIEGRYDKYEDRLPERYGNWNGEIEQWMDTWFEKHNFEQHRKGTP